MRPINEVNRHLPLEEENTIKLPDITDFDRIINNNLKNQELMRNEKAKDTIRKEVRETILNTPLYRLYAETNKFETLNMVKPLYITKRKILELKE
jgi:hypothetical protein